MILIQSSITGFSGNQSTVLSGYDEDNQLLMIHSHSILKRERIKDCFVITNIDDLNSDLLFKPDMLKEAIKSYFFLANSLTVDGSSNRLVLSNKAVRADPSNAIEKDGFNESGDNYRMNENISCAQIAVLATCYYALNNVMSVDISLTMFDELNNINAVEEEFNPFGIITI